MPGTGSKLAGVGGREVRVCLPPSCSALLWRKERKGGKDEEDVRKKGEREAGGKERGREEKD